MPSGIAGDVAAGTVDVLAAVRDGVAWMPEVEDEAAAIDRIRVLEELKSACAAAQSRDAARLDRLRRDAEAAAGVPRDRRGRSVGREVALARRDSATRGSRFLGLAKALVHEMPRTMAALSDGRISEEKATVVCKETAWLTVEGRREVDELMADRMEQLGPRRLESETRAHAQRVDQEAAVAHLERSVKERRVSVRPAPGNMAYLTALLPMPQAVAVFANLQKAAVLEVASGSGGERSVPQIAADLLVERATGQARAEDIPVEVQLVMTDEALVSDGAVPAWLPGYGTVPAKAARDLLGGSEAGVFVRRLFTDPESDQLVAMDSRRRTFSGLLRRMVLIRDGVCRTPWCDAPIRQVDHAQPHAQGGETSWDNASGLCAGCNYAKEESGWAHDATAERLDVTTPTGHRYSADTPRVAGSEDREPRDSGSGEGGPRTEGSSGHGPRAAGSGGDGPRASGSDDRGP